MRSVETWRCDITVHDDAGEVLDGVNGLRA
jgi:hypothetical protein